MKIILREYNNIMFSWGSLGNKVPEIAAFDVSNLSEGYLSKDVKNPTRDDMHFIINPL